MRKRLLLLLTSVLMMVVPCFAAPTNVVVVATQGWQSTGIQVTQGRPYGVWQTGGEWTVDNRLPHVDGAGYSILNDGKIFQGCKDKATLPYGLLRARIGTHIFPIGRVKSFIAPANGMLELSIHDRCVADNGGKLAVSVEEGLDVVGVLQRFTNSLVADLTPSERTRLLEMESNLSACNLAQPNTLSPGCMKILEGLLSTHFSQPPL